MMNEGTNTEKNKREGEEGRLMREVGRETLTAEAAGEYVLPDYQPEIRKILSVRPSVIPAGRYVSGGRAEFAGTVHHSVLYADADGRAAAVILPADYACACPLPEGGPAAVSGDTMTDATVCRPGGPRKLSLRTRVKQLVRITREEDVAPAVRGMGAPEDEASIERLTGSLPSAVPATGLSEEFTVSDTVPLDTNGEDLRVIWCGGNLLVNECRVRENGTCLVRGEAWVRALCAPAAGAPFTVRGKIPFETTAELDGMPAGAAATAYGRILTADASVTPGGAGENGTMTFDVTGICEVTACANRETAVVRDLYSTAYEMDCRYRTLTFTTFAGSTMGNYTVSGAGAPGDAEEVATVVDADGRITVSGVSAEHGRAVVTGEVIASLITAGMPDAEGRTALGTAEIPVPFRIETDLRVEGNETPRFDCHGELISVRGRVEPGTLAADAEIALTLRAFTPREERILESAEPDRSVAVRTDGDRVTVYYPKEGDTLFGVGARYHRSCAGIARRNGLGEEALAHADRTYSLDGVHHLLID